MEKTSEIEKCTQSWRKSSLLPILTNPAHHALNTNAHQTPEEHWLKCHRRETRRTEQKNFISIISKSISSILRDISIRNRL